MATRQGYDLRNVPNINTIEIALRYLKNGLEIIINRFSLFEAAWCAGTNNAEQWIAVDLGTTFQINSVATQG